MLNITVSQEKRWWWGGVLLFNQLDRVRYKTKSKFCSSSNPGQYRVKDRKIDKCIDRQIGRNIKRWKMCISNQLPKYVVKKFESCKKLCYAVNKGKEIDLKYYFPSYLRHGDSGGSEIHKQRFRRFRIKYFYLYSLFARLLMFLLCCLYYTGPVPIIFQL